MHAEGCLPSPQKPVAECPPLGPLQKQVQFNLGNDLGEAPSLPTDLANFLGGNDADEWNDTPHHLASLTAGPSQLPFDNGYQTCPTHTRGAQPNTTGKPMATIWAEPQPRRMPSHVDQADNWILVQISWEEKCPYWWKELRALYWGCLVGDLSNIHALEFSQ